MSISEPEIGIEPETGPDTSSDTSDTVPLQNSSQQYEIHTSGDLASPDGRVFLVVIDETEELQAALEYACRRARTSNGHVALLYVIPPVEFEHFLFVGDAIREDSRNEAEIQLLKYADYVFQTSGKMPIINLREGDRREELLKFVEQETVHVIVLAADPSKNGPGPLISSLMGKDLRRLPVPLAIIPGNLTTDQIQAITEQ